MEFGADNLFKKLRDVLLAKPLYFDIITLETPWQRRWAGKIDKNLAMKQHENMCTVLKSERVRCHFLPIVKDYDQKDSRDVGIISSKGAIVATQKHIDVKGGEAGAFIEFCNKNNIPVLNKDYKIRFEGGDFFFVDESTAIIGVGARTEFTSAEAMQKLLNKPNMQIIPHKVSHHLDGAFNIISKNLAVLDERYVNAECFPYIKNKKIISTSKEDFMTMPANFLLLNENKILADSGCHKFNKILERERVEVIEVEVSELKKNGGSIRCMTLPILRK